MNYLYSELPISGKEEARVSLEIAIKSGLLKFDKNGLLQKKFFKFEELSSTESELVSAALDGLNGVTGETTALPKKINWKISGHQTIHIDLSEEGWPDLSVLRTDTTSLISVLRLVEMLGKESTKPTEEKLNKMITVGLIAEYVGHSSIEKLLAGVLKQMLITF